jgi:spore germination cell wall hydrolase CwlJ-like protein
MTALALRLNEFAMPDALRRHWRAWAVLGFMAVLWLAAAISVGIQTVTPPAELDRAAPASPELVRLRAEADATTATALRQVNPLTALALNAAIPIAQQANPPARPFHLGGSEADRARSLDCLTAAIYYEAANEPTDGQRGVAQVVLNRVRHPAYPNSVCGVVFEGARRSTGCQFSFSCDGSLRRAPVESVWQRARAVAAAALNGYVYAPVGWATHYHANYVMPYWAPTLVKSANVGLHIFYRWRGGWGRPNAFTNNYSGAEPAIAWRGGFGQPIGGVAQIASTRDAAAAQAAAAAVSSGSVDSFQRSVLRRYEPLQQDSASAVIADRARADPGMTNSNRWALTGTDSGPAAQAPLGRHNAAEPPRELQGVRYRWDPTPPAQRGESSDPPQTSRAETPAPAANTPAR